jgi:hypothetical protein
VKLSIRRIAVLEGRFRHDRTLSKARSDHPERALRDV